jgi:ribosomal RNA-processing protein 12
MAAKRLAKKSKESTAVPKDGHVVKYSGSAYKSGKGQGDTLKAGKYEPFAYIQLNPKMLNKRNKAKAVKSFEGIVSHGKKLNKRKGGTGGADEGTGSMLSGINYKK